MKLLSRRAMIELGALQAQVRKVASDRNAALRVFRATRNAAVASAQHEYWLEFSWLDQEYRFAVRKLAEFCARHGAAVTNEEDREAG